MQDLFDRKVKIVATLGPKSSTPEKIQALIQAGIDVARLNFSHGDHEFHTDLFTKVRNEAKRSGRNIAILQDLQGPKLRIGTLPKAGLRVQKGSILEWVSESDLSGIDSKKTVVPIPDSLFLSLKKDLTAGNGVLLDDGKLEGSVRENKPGLPIFIEMANDGVLFSKKGVHFPGIQLSLESFTEKDMKDLQWGLEHRVDAIALSFIRSAKEIEAVRERIKAFGKWMPFIFAKIEKEEAIDHYESILEVSDGILIARGDMALEVGVSRVPIVQKRLIRACNELGVPVITATQMLESMIHSASPTRAEASDIANAVLDGTDAVMLSGETAAGRYPVESVKTMRGIIINTEKNFQELSQSPKLLPLAGSMIDSIAYSAARIANHVDANLIACVSRSGQAAHTIAKYRPDKPIIAILHQEPIYRRMAFVWGVTGLLVNQLTPTDDLFEMVEKILIDHHYVEEKDWIVMTMGVPSLKKGTTNTIKVHQIKSD